MVIIRAMRATYSHNVAVVNGAGPPRRLRYLFNTAFYYYATTGCPVVSHRQGTIHHLSLGRKIVFEVWFGRRERDRLNSQGRTGWHASGR